MIAVKLDFDDADLVKFLEAMGPAQIQVAINRAVRKTAQWVRTHLLRKVKDETGIARKVIAYRAQLYNKAWRSGGDGGKAVKVWFGVDPIKADKIDTPIKTAKGYRVKKWDFEGGFMPPTRKGRLFQRVGKERLPIRRATVEIDEQGTAAFNEIAELIPARMRELAVQELRYEMHKAMGTI